VGAFKASLVDRKECLRQDMLQSLSERTAPYIPLNEPWSITAKPENIMIVVAGGEQSGHSYWMQIGTSYKPVCREVKLRQLGGVAPEGGKRPGEPVIPGDDGLVFMIVSESFTSPPENPQRNYLFGAPED